MRNHRHMHIYVWNYVWVYTRLWLCVAVTSLPAPLAIEGLARNRQDVRLTGQSPSRAGNAKNQPIPITGRSIGASLIKIIFIHPKTTWTKLNLLTLIELNHWTDLTWITTLVFCRAAYNWTELFIIKFRIIELNQHWTDLSLIMTL